MIDLSDIEIDSPPLGSDADYIPSTDGEFETPVLKLRTKQKKSSLNAPNLTKKTSKSSLFVSFGDM